jgi:peptidoglycan/LPS O-acetylase OafA/YrhL
LDGIRGVAAILIAIRHSSAFFGAIDFQESYLAVDVFFVLSGVVIADAYEERLQSNLSVKGFAWLRIVRLYPLYLLGLAISVLAISLGVDDRGNAGQLVTLVPLALFMLPNATRMGNNAYPLNHPSWSLFFELVANVGYAKFLNVLTVKRLIAIMAMCATGLAVGLCFTNGHNLNLGFLMKQLPAGLLRVGYSFSAGVLLYRLYVSRGSTPITGLRASLALWGVLIVVAAILMMSPRAAIWPYFDLLSVIVIFPAIIHLAMRIEPGRLSASICKLMGTISFALYATHQPLGALTRGLLKDWLGFSVENYAPAIGGGFLVLLLGFCWVLVIAYDLPIRSFLLARTARRPMMMRLK